MHSLNGSFFYENHGINFSRQKNDNFRNDPSYETLHNYTISSGQMSTENVNQNPSIIKRPKSSCSKFQLKKKNKLKKENIPLPLGKSYAEISLNACVIKKNPINNLNMKNTIHKFYPDYKRRKNLNKEIKSEIVIVNSNEDKKKKLPENCHNDNYIKQLEEFKTQTKIKELVGNELVRRALQIKEPSKNFKYSLNFLNVLAKYDNQYYSVLNDISEISNKFINQFEEELTCENKIVEKTLQEEKNKNKKLKESLHLLKYSNSKSKTVENPIIPKPLGDNIPDFESTRRTNLDSVLINDIDQKINDLQIS